MLLLQRKVSTVEFGKWRTVLRFTPRDMSSAKRLIAIAQELDAVVIWRVIKANDLPALPQANADASSSSADSRRTVRLRAEVRSNHGHPSCAYVRAGEAAGKANRRPGADGLAAAGDSVKRTPFKHQAIERKPAKQIDPGYTLRPRAVAAGLEDWPEDAAAPRNPARAPVLPPKKGRP